MKEILKQKTLYIGVVSLVLAIGMIVLQSITGYSDSTLSTYESAMNNHDLSKLSSVVSPERAAMLNAMSGLGDALGDAFGGLGIDVDSDILGTAKDFDQYTYLPGYSYSTENERVLHYIMVPKNPLNNVQEGNLYFEKMDGKEYLSGY